MAHTDTSHTAVWLLLLDCFPLPSPDSAVAPASDHPEWHPCDDLDAQAICFEQFYSQNLTSHCSVTDYLGGAEAFQVFLNRLQAAGKGFHHTTLEAKQTTLTTHESGLLVLTASGCESAETLAAVLQQFQFLRAQHPKTLPPPALVITSLKGISRSLPKHFDCPCAESEIRVPLWILSDQLQSARIQLLCGSHDLLPTIADLLALPTDPESTESLSASQNTAQAPNSPCSLIQLSRMHPDSMQRILTIHGNDWMGLRTQHYFLVQTSTSQTESPESQNCRLYQKPDDYWNVNNCLSACQEIADAMLLAAGHSPGSPH